MGTNGIIKPLSTFPLTSALDKSSQHRNKFWGNWATNSYLLMQLSYLSELDSLPFAGVCNWSFKSFFKSSLNQTSDLNDQEIKMSLLAFCSHFTPPPFAPSEVFFFMWGKCHPPFNGAPHCCCFLYSQSNMRKETDLFSWCRFVTKNNSA